MLEGSTSINGARDYTITVGAGGTPGNKTPDWFGGYGGNSSIGTTVVSTGGGGGVSHGDTVGRNGGSGGGGAVINASGNPPGVAGTGIAGQGNNGGAGISLGSWGYANAGGGGAGAVGTAAGAGPTNGGAGRVSWISGNGVYYAGGGGGAPVTSGSAGAGGAGGGGAGRNSAAGQEGTANLGGGGGGGSFSNGQYYAGGAGGSGIVIVRYLTSAATSSTGGTKTTSGNYTIHTFTSSGTLNIVVPPPDPNAIPVDYLVVAGGGAGGTNGGGGGGAGGLLAGSASLVPIVVASTTTNQTYDATVSSSTNFTVNGNTYTTTGQYCSILFKVNQTSGKVYLEFTVTTPATDSGYGLYYGVQRPPTRTGNYHDGTSGNGNGGLNVYYAVTSAGTYGVLIDIDAQTVSWNGAAAVSIPGTGQLYFALYDGTSSGTGSTTINWGVTSFANALPSGAIAFGTTPGSTSNTYAIVVGAGGATSAQPGANGNNSSIATLSLTAVGGGGGAGRDAGGPGQNGGSGGGGADAAGSPMFNAGSGTTGQGNSGGAGTSGSGAGGGGGAGAAGGAGGGGTNGPGGIGLQSSITGTATYYAGGGGGARCPGLGSGGGAGGTGGGGAGASGGGTSGTANTGGGGGGNGGLGGSGIVIVKYLTADVVSGSASGGTVTTSGLYTIRTFTSSGSLTLVKTPSGAPIISTAPVITGSLPIGGTLSCTTGTWTSEVGTPTYTYQWNRAGVAISGATSSTYTTINADAWQAITCTVTATNTSGYGTATSNTLIPVITTYIPILDVFTKLAGVVPQGDQITVTESTEFGLTTKITTDITETNDLLKSQAVVTTTYAYTDGAPISSIGGGTTGGTSGPQNTETWFMG
jgi:hypothetical protein